MANDWDPDGGTLTDSLVDNPIHGTLTSFTGLTGVFTYVPTSDYVGLDSFTYKVNDGSLDSNVPLRAAEFTCPSRSSFEQIRTQTPAEVTATVRAHGPPDWIIDLAQ